MGSTRPDNVGILALDIYFPLRYVSQEDLEQFDGVSEGKYTEGLGQVAMSFVGDREDTASMALSAVRRLVEGYRVDYGSIGRLSVATETPLDRSKSIKSVLMDLFAASGNSDVEGVDSMSGCYGGTAALLDAANWIESRSWDGRYAMVVCSDVAVYPPGPARPSGGAGAVAMLVGPDAPLALERRLTASHMENTYDFFKPTPSDQYPIVDGQLSTECYLRALHRCYARLCDKSAKANPGRQFSLADVDYLLMHHPYNKLVRKAAAALLYHDHLRSDLPPPVVPGGEGGVPPPGLPPTPPGPRPGTGSSRPNSREDPFESPPVLGAPPRSAGGGSPMRGNTPPGMSPLAPLKPVPPTPTPPSGPPGSPGGGAGGGEGAATGSAPRPPRGRSPRAGGAAGAGGGGRAVDKETRAALTGLKVKYGTSLPEGTVSRDLEKELVALSRPLYDERVEPGTLAGRECGNLYTASVWASLLSLVCSAGGAGQLEGRRALIFSFGSGLASTALAVRARAPGSAAHSRFTLDSIARLAMLKERLEVREPAPPEDLVDACGALQRRHEGGRYEPRDPVDTVAPGTYYLHEVTAGLQRVYRLRAGYGDDEDGDEFLGGAAAAAAAAR